MDKFDNIILHIGPYKTGSTAIQVFCSEHRELLRNKGLIYPSFDNSTSHQKLQRFIINPEYDHIDSASDWLNTVHDAAHFNKICRDITDNDGKTLLISEETFCDFSPKYIMRLKAFLNQFTSNKFKIVLYLRRQLERTISDYSQSLRNGSINTDILHYNMYRPSDNYELLLNTWSDIFSPTSIQPKIYDKESWLKNNLIIDFLNECGISDLEFDVPRRMKTINQSLSEQAQEFLLQTNILLKDDESEEAIIIKKAIRAALEKEGFGKSKTPTKEEAILFQSNFQEMNKQIAHKWFPDKEVLFNNDFSKYPDFNEFNTNSNEFVRLAISAMREFKTISQKN